MIWVLCTTALAVELSSLDRHDLVRVEDPDHPDALTSSATGSVLAEPPTDGTPWSWESVPHTDGWPSFEAIEVMNADGWHDAGFRGQGVRVAVLDVQWFGAERDPSVLGEVTTADCYRHRSCEVPLDTFHARFGFEQGVHGYACAQVVRDVAPEAELFLVRVNGYTTFENAAYWAIRNDIDILSMSMSFFNASFYDGTGSFSEIMNELEANNVLVVTSSGNYAREHWSGPWRDSDADWRFDFDGDNRLPVNLSSGRRTIYVNWDEHYRCGESDLDAYVYDRDGNLVGRAEGIQDFEGNNCSPVERVSATVEESGIHYLELRAKRVSGTNLGVDILLTQGTVVNPVRAYSIVDPATHRFAFTVGAVNQNGYLDNDVQGFSSQGPVRSGALKPDIAGPDGVSSHAYGTEGFFGTSAATPAVSGALALVMSRYPELTPREAAERLKGWALSETPGHYDPRWGAGKARLPVVDVQPAPCGRRPLWAMLLLPPFLFRRRQTSSSQSGPS